MHTYIHTYAHTNIHTTHKNTRHTCTDINTYKHEQVTDVWVSGRRVLEKRKLTTLNEESLVEKVFPS
jgi:hypothetical protein